MLGLPSLGPIGGRMAGCLKGDPITPSPSVRNSWSLDTLEPPIWSRPRHLMAAIVGAQSWWLWIRHELARLITPKPAAFIDHGAVRELPGVVRRTGAAAVSVDSGAASSDSGGVTLVAAGGGSPIDAAKGIAHRGDGRGDQRVRRGL